LAYAQKKRIGKIMCVGIYLALSLNIFNVGDASMPKQTIVNHLARIRSKQPWMVMSAADEFCLAGSDHPTISHYYGFEAGHSAEPIFAIPDGCVDILFDCDTTSPKAEVYGTPMEAMQIELIPKHRYFGVRFASGIMPDWLDVSAKDLIEQHVSFLSVATEAEQVFEAIVRKPDFLSQVASFKDYFNGKKARHFSPLTIAALQYIFDHNGNVRIDELEVITGYTTRTIQRQFLSDLGFSPKVFCRIVRCQSAVYAINHKEITFSDMACDLGFTDQSHFLKEFKKLVSATPLAYQDRVKQHTYLDKIHYC
jgi:AraC-like DNA-binding protein